MGGDAGYDLAQVARLDRERRHRIRERAAKMVATLNSKCGIRDHVTVNDCEGGAYVEADIWVPSEAL